MTAPPTPAQQPRPRVKYFTRVAQLPNVPEAQRQHLEAVEQRYAFRITDYYAGLIDWTDPDDPIRQLVIPRIEELNRGGDLDASNEASVTVAGGTQHKYPDTVLLLCNEECGACCRYCFRKRLLMADNSEACLDLSAGIAHIRAHPEVTNVLLTGGDPLVMAPRRLLAIIEELRAIEHVQIIRIGSKMLAFNPWVILDHPELVAGLAAFSTPEKRIYLMNHFDHPRELTQPAIAALDTVIRAGVICANQCPIIRGVNDSVETLVTLFRKLSFAGAPPYYLFQGRPTQGNKPYQVPLARGFTVFEQARHRISGLAARARMAMSHELGKVEIVGMDEKRFYMRFHRAKCESDRGRFMIFRRDDDAYWLDDLVPVGPVTASVRSHLRCSAAAQQPAEHACGCWA